MYVRCWDSPPGPAGFWAPLVPPAPPLLPPPPPPLLLLPPLPPAEPDWRSENATNDSIVIKILREGLTEKTDEPEQCCHDGCILPLSFFPPFLVIQTSVTRVRNSGCKDGNIFTSD